MQTNRPRCLLLAALVGPALLAAGCNAVTPFGTFKTYGTNQPTYVVGHAAQTFAVPASREVVAQTREAMDDLGIHSVVQRLEDPAIVLVGKTANGRTATVTVRPDGASTHVSARFGTLGDEALSRAFLARVGTRIGADTGAPQADALKKPPATNRLGAGEPSAGASYSGRSEDGTRQTLLP
jgi:hypothetical protein